MSIVKTMNVNPTEAEELFDKTLEILENRKISQEEIRKDTEGESDKTERKSYE